MHHAKQSTDEGRLQPAAHLVENAESALVVHIISARLCAVELGPGLAPHLRQEQLAAHGTKTGANQRLPRAFYGAADVGETGVAGSCDPSATS